MGNSFKIKVRSENDEVNEISINSLDKIKNIKSIICSLQKKYIQRYLLIYKGNQLLEDENTVSSYNIIPNETLTYKSSKKIYLIFFSEYKKKAGKYVTDDDTIYSAFYSLKNYFDSPKGSIIREFIFKGYRIDLNTTFGEHGMKEFDCIVITYKEDKRKG